MNSIELSDYCDLFGFNIRSVDEIISKEPPKLEVYLDYYFGIIDILNKKDIYSKPKKLAFFLKENLLLYVYDQSETIQNIIYDLQNTKKYKRITKENILYILFDNMTNDHFRILEKFETEITELDDDIIEGKKKRNIIHSVVNFRKKLLFLKAYYEHLLDITEEILENELEIIDEKYIGYFKILTKRVDRLSKNVQNLRDNVTQLREAYQAQLDISLNNIMKLFTVITAIFLPLTLIAGWYGMNFDNMPEIHWRYGYLYVIVFSILIVVICLLYFKKKKFM